MNVVLLTLIATLLIQLGYFMWKLSAEGQPKIGGEPIWVVARALLSDWRWVLGFLCTCLGWVLFVQATSLGDISLVQPLMSAGDFLLVIMAVIFLKERLHPIEWVGILLTVVGAFALAFEAKNSVVASYEAGQLIILTMVLLGVSSLLLLANRKSRHPELLLALVVGICFGSGAALTKALTIGHSEPGQIVGTWAILLDPLLLAVILANVAGLVLLQAAFQRGRAAVIVPLQLSMANIVTVVAGVFIFAEYISTLRAGGIALVLIGTGLLHIRPHKTD